ncbi:MAG: peroxiredoxin-like family protein [Bacteroidales bacterium]|nr:peroxiredoxin-like family protein [Bacteroidales bacterium]MDT8374238.1 peroxiredoxin-like family protein [Bacteroidales bacterium]
MKTLNAQKKRTVIEAKGLSVGAKAPTFSAPDAGLNIFSLEEAIKNGPVVLIFYRGFWCPYCNKHLAHLQENLKQITEKGASVIAISPEKPEYLEKMARKSGAGFTLLYDEGNKISDAYDVTFTPASVDLFVYNYVLNGRLKQTHSDDSQRLPIPATYIIDIEGTIVWRQFDRDYKKRSTVKDIISNLP